MAEFAALGGGDMDLDGDELALLRLEPEKKPEPIWWPPKMPPEKIPSIAVLKFACTSLRTNPAGAQLLQAAEARIADLEGKRRSGALSLTRYLTDLDAMKKQLGTMQEPTARTWRQHLNKEIQHESKPSGNSPASMFDGSAPAPTGGGRAPAAAAPKPKKAVGGASDAALMAELEALAGGSIGVAGGAEGGDDLAAAEAGDEGADCGEPPGTGAMACAGPQQDLVHTPALPLTPSIPLSITM